MFFIYVDFEGKSCKNVNTGERTKVIYRARDSKQLEMIDTLAELKQDMDNAVKIMATNQQLDDNLTYGKSETTRRQLEERSVPIRYDAMLATTTNRVAVDDQIVSW